MNLPAPIIPLLQRLTQEGMTPIIVGGYVRDSLMHQYSKDIDIEVYGCSDIEALKTSLSPFGAPIEVGSSFGVLKLRLNDLHLDLSLPRLESKIAEGHKGFRVDTTVHLNFNEAAQRRDFTINAMGYNTVTHQLLDPYNGVDDLKKGILREVNANHFGDDPLRLYRTMQFAARFKLRISDSLRQICSSMVASGELESLPKERIFEEFKKLLLQAAAPSVGIKLLREFGALRYFEALESMASQQCHSQKNLFEHTLLTLDTMALMRCGDASKDLIMMLSILCHKMPQNGKAFLTKLTNDRKLIEAVTTLVHYNRYPQKMYDARASDANILQLATKVCIADLIHVAKAIDLKCHRQTPQHRFRAGEWLANAAQTLHVYKTPPKPLLQGRDLIAQGLKPSQAFKQILDAAYQAQLQQQFTCKTEAHVWLRHYLHK